MVPKTVQIGTESMHTNICFYNNTKHGTVTETKHTNNICFCTNISRGAEEKHTQGYLVVLNQSILTFRFVLTF